MAKVGGGAAYQQLKVPEDGISQALQYWGGIKAEKSAAKKLADERAGVRKEERFDKMIEGIPASEIEAVMTGQEGIDNVTTNFAKSQLTRYNEMKKSARTKLEGGDEAGFREDEDKMRQINQSFTSYKNLIETIKPQVEDYMKNIDEYNPNDSRYKIQDALIRNNVIPFQDKDGNLKIVVGLDKDGDGEISDEERKKANDYIRDGAQTGELEYEIISAHDLTNGFYNQFKKVNINEKDGVLDQLASATGMATKNEKTGAYEMTKTIGFDQTKYDSLHKASQAQLQDPETAAWVMNTALGIKDRVEGFSEDEMEKAAEWLTNQTIARFPTTSSKEFMSAKYSADTRPKPTDKTKDPSLSRLNYDADQFVTGDYTGLLGVHETEYGETINIREVIPAPEGNYVVAVTDAGEEIEIPNTKRGFLEFKIRNKPEYKGLTPEKVMDNAATEYRQGTIGGAEVSAIAKSMFDEEGKPKYDDEKFLEKLKDNFDITGEDVFTWSGNSLVVNGIPVSTASQKAFESSLKEALSGMTGGNVR